MMAAETRCAPSTFLPDDAPTVDMWGLYLWAAGRAIVAPAVAVAVRLRAWWTRPVTNPRPYLMPCAPKAADTYGRHDRSVGEQTVPLADLLAQLGYQPAPRRPREPRLFGTDPLHEWTHPERYPAVPQRPDGCPLWPCSDPTSHFTPDFNDTEVSA